jgi:hypothetical protein
MLLKESESSAFLAEVVFILDLWASTSEEPEALVVKMGRNYSWVTTVAAIDLRRQMDP